ncbi:helix-turn-helix domain-containing protein [Arthrobacter sp. SF27]|uniref:helix-turn-helix domain-containing protein n=1 Tax=Crystallibacter degradans TaxID=2726743 RepID=UPI0014753F1B|nr:hypothetical protein [Arthrobacter sp. SF27]
MRSKSPRGGTVANSRNSQSKQEAHVNKLHASDEYSTRELAELFSVGRSTVYRAIRRAEPKLSGP